VTALLLVITPVVPIILFAAEDQPKSNDPGRLSILRKLDVRKVGLRIDSQAEVSQRLRARAIARLKKVGLEPASDLPGTPVDAVLVLVVNQIPLGKKCAGKVLYDSKIYLIDDVTIKRDPEIKLEAITWSLAPGHPSVVEAVPIESLEADADRLIDQFIIGYGLVPANQ
jgi:hypothetical protein